jgi:hypothetical protein
MFLLEENKHSFVVAPASDAVRLVSPMTSKAAPQLRPVKILSNEVNEMMKPLDKTSEMCGRHKEEKGCIVDMQCGWCMGGEGGRCVSGDFSGPLDRALPCPLYVTYQIPEKQDDIAAEDLFPSHSANSTDASNTNAFADDTLQFIVPKEVPIDIEEEEEEPQLPIPDIRHAWSKSPNMTEIAKQTPKPPAPRTPQSAHVPILTMPHAVSGFDASISPCGLPGVPPFICQAWLKTHCGPNQLTDSVIKNLPAANNGYDWCATIFENNPEIFGPEHKPFPWYINGQLVSQQ